ncbi:MAG: twitching motility protein PilT, partial [Polaromonas sp.]|nr:twitching motility protein PilT [Polaromonas sp.]
MTLTDLLTIALARQASDLHLAAGMPPMLRVHGLIEALDWPVQSQSDVAALLSQVMTAQQRELFAQTLELDLAWTHAVLGRFRVNAFMQSRGAAAVFRCIPAAVPALASLGAPAVLAELALRPRGLVLVTG